MRYLLCLILTLLAAAPLRAADPSTESASAAYSMESTIELVGATQEPQASGAYEVHSQKDYEVSITPVELSEFEVE